MSGLKFSVVIPYKQRLHNIQLAFASLAEQTMDAAEFEIVVGAMEYSQEYTAACQQFSDRLNIVTIMTSGEWNVSHARNIAMRHATGEVMLVLDADMVIPTNLLQHLYQRYFARQGNVCVAGQMIGYSCAVGQARSIDELDLDADNVAEERPYSHYRRVLAALEASPDQVIQDARWSLESISLPWTLVWTGLMALPAATVRQHGLYFDEGFKGWGSEDQEWGYRVHLSGTPIVLGDNVYGLHVPHTRDTVRSFETFRANWRYFLSKSPALEVEVAHAFDWEEGNRRYPEITRELSAIAGPGNSLAVIRGTAGGAGALLIGAQIDAHGSLTGAERSYFDDGQPIQVLPLAGFSLPYPDKTIEECRISPLVMKLSERYREAICLEASRVADHVAWPVPVR
jgi:GT2 family glycosyltransferase